MLDMFENMHAAKFDRFCKQNTQLHRCSKDFERTYPDAAGAPSALRALGGSVFLMLERIYQDLKIF